MSRKEFMEQLEKLLMDIPQEERVEALSYYNGYFEDAGVENEENIIRELESPEKVAKIIKADIGVDEEMEYTETGYEDTRFHQQEEIIKNSKTTEQKAEYQDTCYEKAGFFEGEDRTLKIVLVVLVAILTCPIWIAALGSLIGVICGVLGTAFGIAVAGVAVVFALYVVGFTFLGVGIGMFGMANVPAGIGLLGASMITLALAVLGTVGCVWLFGAFLPWLIKEIGKLFRRLFRKRRTVA